MVGIQVELVVVPIEECLTGLLELLEESMFHFIQDIEAYKHVGIVGQGIGIQCIDDFPIEHPFVGDALGFELLPETVVDGTQHIPYRDEFLFQCRVLLDGEVTEELLDGGFLLRVHEGVVIHQRTEILQVGKQLAGIYQILVGIIEIAQQELTPEVEIIQGFLALGRFLEDLVEFANQLHRIAHFTLGKAPEQFTDADGGRRPHGLVGLLRQVFVEEQSCTLVGEYQCRAGQLPFLAAIKVGRYLFQETFHIVYRFTLISSISFLNTYHKYPFTSGYPIWVSLSMYMVILSL